jgi:excinuclease ABC subunit A
MPDNDSIHLRGVRVHNLKHVDVDFPLRRMTVISGVSGSGKSSLAFDTLYAEAQRRYLQSFSTYTRQFLERLDRPDADQIDNLPPAIAVSQRSLPRGVRSTVGTLTEVVDYVRLLFARAGTICCPKCGHEIRTSTVNDVVEAVERLPAGTRVAIAFPSRPDSTEEGISWATGLKEEGLLRVQIGDAVLRLGEDALPPISEHTPVWVLVDRLEVGRLARERLIDSIETAFGRGGGRMALLGGAEPAVFDQRQICPHCGFEFPALEPRLFSFNDPLGACPTCEGTGMAASKSRHADPTPCPVCHGTRLNDMALSVRVAGRTIAELDALSVRDLAAFWANPPTPERPDVKIVVDQIGARLGYLQSVDLDYLSLDRAASTLSTGEAQRVRLTTALAANLVNALYVLDEPTTGLHPHDTGRLLTVLLHLRDAGNTLAVVENDASMLRAADHLVDLGPGAGEEGGQVIYQGPPAGVLDCPDSVTSAYLAGRQQIPVPTQRRPSQGTFRVVGARVHNLKDVTVDFPLGVLCVVTGVSGAGKSSLVQDTLYPALVRREHKLNKSSHPAPAPIIGGEQIGDVVLMDQTPLSRTQRSNPVTYLKIFDEIRKLFADTPEAKVRHFGPGTFSFNQPGGRCETCQGQGTITVDMQFLADVAIICPDCQGRRYKRDVLGVKVRSLNITEVLDLTVREAFRFFRAQPLIERRLKVLLDVGLEYVRLGQATDTLSGGECQRLKLAAHLAASRKPRTLFLLDEPTAGLHVADIARLLDCFARLLDTGHSLVVVEHHFDFIKCADHVIDLGPGAGSAGGEIVAAGTPEEIAAASASVTGQWLRQVLPPLQSAY